MRISRAHSGNLPDGASGLSVEVDKPSKSKLELAPRGMPVDHRGRNKDIVTDTRLQRRLTVGRRHGTGSVVGSCFGLIVFTAVMLSAGGCARTLCLSAPAKTMQVTAGLVDYQVVQRDVQNKGELCCSGVTSFDGRGTVLARLSCSKRVLICSRNVGTVANSAWKAKVADVPVGGPYRLDLTICDEKGAPVAGTSIHDLLVGDLWMLGGQSNMQGYGDTVDVETPSPLVHVFGLNDTWSVAEEPLHRIFESVDPVHCSLPPEEKAKRAAAERKHVDKGSGLGLPFAKEMVARTGVPVGLVACSLGGTSMDQWSPEKKGEGGRSLYGQMVRRFNVVGGRVAGVLWYQGESDTSPTAAPAFKEKFKTFVQSVRNDFNAPDMPFYYVQLGRFVTKVEDPHWNMVQESQRQCEGEIARSGMAASLDLSLDDLIHVGTQGLKRLGKRLAKLASSDMSKAQALKRGPRFASIRYADNKRTRVRVEFSGVNGALTSSGRISGFSIRSKDGTDLRLLYNGAFDPNNPNAVILKLQSPPPSEAYLWYGWGRDPYCNVVDEEDMALPAFGPVALPETANP